MTTRYKLIADIDSTPVKAVRRAEDNWSGNVTCIPFDELNTDYLEYKEWLDAGNTPEAAD